MSISVAFHLKTTSIFPLNACFPLFAWISWQGRWTARIIGLSAIGTYKLDELQLGQDEEHIYVFFFTID